MAAGKHASIALRVNPDVSAITHPYISTGLREHKFGIDISVVEEVYARAMKLPGLVPDGVSCHIGSQLLDVDPIVEAAEKVLALVNRLRHMGVPVRHVDLGGGLGIPYRPTESAAGISGLATRLRQLCIKNDVSLMIEPGRSIVGEAGALLTRVLLLKQNGSKTFVVVDAAMNDLLRPSLIRRITRSLLFAKVKVAPPLLRTWLARFARLAISLRGDESCRICGLEILSLSALLGLTDLCFRQTTTPGPAPAKC